MNKLFTAGKLYGHCVGKKFAAAELTGSAVTLFTILGGPIKVHNLGMLVTTAIPAGANTLKIDLKPTSTAVDLCGATDTASAAVDQLFVVNGAKATGLVKTTDVGVLAAGQTLTSTMPIILGPGIVRAVWSGGPPATGAALFFMEYEPLSQFSEVHVD